MNLSVARYSPDNLSEEQKEESTFNPIIASAATAARAILALRYSAVCGFRIFRSCRTVIESADCIKVSLNL